MRTGLLLGGGGAVGIAWENGVLAGLADGCGFDPTLSTVIVGTSAGSAVGADMALGKDPHNALDRDDLSSNPRRDLAPPDFETGAFAEIIGLMMSPEAGTPEVVERIGRLAVEAETTMGEEQFVEMFRRTVGTDEWPNVDFRATAACCSTGEPVVWSSADGIPLSRAVASSCAIPGYFPAVGIAGDHYIDGNRGTNYHAAIVAELELDAALFIGPKIPVPGVERMTREDMEAIAERGVRCHTILGSERLDAAGLNLMDFSSRALGFEIGVADGAANAAVVAEMFS